MAHSNAILSGETLERLQAAAFLVSSIQYNTTQYLTAEANQFRVVQERFEYSKLNGTFCEEVALDYIRCVKEMYESYRAELFSDDSV